MRNKLFLALDIVQGILLLIIFIGGLYHEDYHWCYMAIMLFISQILIKIYRRIVDNAH